MTFHAGDVLNFELVRELAELEQIESGCVYVADDISSAPPEQKEERRGIAGRLAAFRRMNKKCRIRKVWVTEKWPGFFVIWLIVPIDICQRYSLY